MKNSYFTKDAEHIENYELALKDNFKGWVIHHRFETHRRNGSKRKFAIPAIVLKQAGLYYNQPANELIFMDWSEHMKLHGTFGPWNKGTKGVCKPNKGSWRKGQVAHNKGIPCKESTKQKLSDINHQKRCYNNGLRNKYFWPNEEIPAEYKPGMLRYSK